MPERGEILYILGAGVNQCLHDRDGHSPPLGTTVFRAALRDRTGAGRFQWQGAEPLFDLIARRAGLSRADLEKLDFDFEAPLRWLERAEEDHSDDEDPARVRAILWYILSTTLSDYAWRENWSETLRELAKVLWLENAAVISFNYDVFLEKNLSNVAGQRRWNPADTSMDSIGPNWLPEDGYSVQFDDVIQSMPPGRPKEFRAPADYPTVEFLKPHGSLNWFRTTNHEVAAQDHALDPTPPTHEPGSLVLAEDRWQGFSWPFLDGRYLDPLIIAGSDSRKAIERGNHPFDRIWTRAGELLAAAKWIIPIGYSFRDDEITRFFREHIDPNRLEKVTPVVPSHFLARQIQDKLGAQHTPHCETVERFVWKHPLHFHPDLWARGFQDFDPGNWSPPQERVSDRFDRYWEIRDRPPGPPSPGPPVT